MTSLQFTTEEFDIMSNAELLLRKRVIQDKVFQLLEKTQHEIDTGIDADLKTRFPSGKISRGENYRGLPYLILDHPAHFKINDIFACRTMFLWGKFFSVTVHLQGYWLKEYRTFLNEIIGEIELSEVYVSKGTSPWHYHYAEDNYVPLTGQALEESFNAEFIKVSKRIPLKNYNLMPVLAHKFYQPFLNRLTLKQF
jgi:hypothetical protein